MTTLTDAVEGLEASLGDPAHDQDTGFTATLRADESEAFPFVGWAKLGSVSFPSELVPLEVGGSFSDAERLLALVRTVARRDLTLAAGIGQCFLGALPVWIVGEPGQKTFVASALANGESGALAITERDHGSDLGATSTAAVQDGAGYRLEGGKWAINNAGRGRFLAVLARTDEAGGARGFSLFLVDALMAHDSSTALTKIPTLGIRGADLGGRSFEDTPLDADALLGKVGTGLELVQKTLQVARTLSGGYALGVADTALRAALGFAESRVLYGVPTIALGAPRAALRDAFLAFHTADLVAHASARGLSIAPEQAAAPSAIAKILVPETAVAIVDAAAQVLGSRHYFRVGPHAIVQKLVRDVRMLPVFDGSSSVNRSALAHLLASIARTRLESDDLAAAVERTIRLVDVGAILPPLAFDRLRVGGDSGACDAFHALSAFASGFVPIPATARPLAARVNGVAERLRTLFDDAGIASLPGTSERAHRIVDVFVDLYAASLLVARTRLADADELVVLEAALRRTIARLEGPAPLDFELDDPVDASARLDAAMARCLAEGRAFGPLGPRLAETPSTWRVS